MQKYDELSYRTIYTYERFSRYERIIMYNKAGKNCLSLNNRPSCHTRSKAFATSTVFFSGVKSSYFL